MDINSLLGQFAGTLDIQSLAGKIGLSPEQTAAGVQALGLAHAEPGDTVETAAASSGLSVDSLRQLVGQIGGEGALGQLGSLFGGGQSEGGMLGGLASSLLGGGQGKA